MFRPCSAVFCADGAGTFFIPNKVPAGIIDCYYIRFFVYYVVIHKTHIDSFIKQKKYENRHYS